MQIVYHIGAHRTDEGALLRSLLKNRETLLTEGIAVPGPSRYREIIRDLTQTLRGAPADADMQDLLLGASLDSDEVRRVVFSNESFICVPSRALDDGRLYARTFKSTWLRNLFPEAEVEFALALRNPAAFVSALFAQQRRAGLRYADFIADTEPETLCWSDFVARLAEANPGCRITVWANEDTPVIWQDVMRAVTGLGDEIALDGTYDIIRRVVRREGMRRMRTYLARRPPACASARRQVMGAFLDKYAIPEQIEEEIDLPGWTAEMVDAMTGAYEADLTRIAAIPGVRLIAP